MSLLKRSWKRRDGLPRLETRSPGNSLSYGAWRFGKRLSRSSRLKCADKIEIEEATRGQRRRVNAGVDFRHAPVHVLVLGDPRTNDAYPMRTKLDKWEAHFYSSLANCVLQMLLAAEVLGLSSMYISDVASPYFSVMLKSLLGIPEPLQIYHLLPIGFAKRSPTIHHPRRALEEMVHHERYDRSKFRGEAELQDFMMKMSIRGKEYSF